MKKTIIIVCLFAISSLLLTDVTLAQNNQQGLVPDNGKYEKGNYNLDDLIRILIIAANFILGLVGALALAAFVYGGVILLISAGSSEKVTQGKTILTNAIIGLVIVFVSWLIIKFVMSTMGLDWKGEAETPQATQSNT